VLQRAGHEFCCQLAGVCFSAGIISPALVKKTKRPVPFGSWTIEKPGFKEKRRAVPRPPPRGEASANTTGETKGEYSSNTTGEPGSRRMGA